MSCECPRAAAISFGWNASGGTIGNAASWARRLVKKAGFRLRASIEYQVFTESRITPS